MRRVLPGLVLLTACGGPPVTLTLVQPLESMTAVELLVYAPTETCEALLATGAAARAHPRCGTDTPAPCTRVPPVTVPLDEVVWIFVPDGAHRILALGVDASNAVVGVGCAPVEVRPGRTTEVVLRLTAP